MLRCSIIILGSFRAVKMKLRSPAPGRRHSIFAPGAFSMNQHPQWIDISEVISDLKALGSPHIKLLFIGILNKIDTHRAILSVRFNAKTLRRCFQYLDEISGCLDSTITVLIPLGPPPCMAGSS